MKPDLKNYTAENVKTLMTEWNLPAYRARQIYTWLFSRNIHAFSEMTDLPKTLQTKLSESFRLGELSEASYLSAADGTEKYAFSLDDGALIESVLIPAEKRLTACLSTQAGCKFACVFCASGVGGFHRNLTTAEIIEQVLYLKEKKPEKLSNYVFMGMGEPLDNLENLYSAISIMNDPHGLEIASRRISVSTCGIVPGIRRLAEWNLQIQLSVSLHAANDALRNTLMPVNKRYPLKDLIEACSYYHETKGRMITLEYILIDGVNDTEKDARDLAGIQKKLRSKINLIPCSDWGEGTYRRPSEKRTQEFVEYLKAAGGNLTFRNSKGNDIQAACGQLAGKLKNEP